MALESERTDGSRAAGNQWWISLNVARTRVSLLGFNLSVIAFLIGLLLTVFEGQAFIATQAHQLQDVVLDEPESVLSIFAWQFLQPLTW